MRVGILSYPMLFQREGGLQVQVRSTIAALNGLNGHNGIDSLHVALADPTRERLDAYDVIHVFAAINGNHRVVEAAHDMGVPVVLSPLLAPGWNRATGLRAQTVDRLAGKLTSWSVQTSYAQTKRALQLAELVIALGDAERRAIVDGFQVDGAKIRVYPNGIAPAFFRADASHFRAHSKMAGPFVLMSGAVSPYKNQLGVARALVGTALPLVMVGQVQREHQNYLDAILALPGTRWLGALAHDDPLLASTYAAAAALALPSQGEVFPLAVLEALAAGTPVVMTNESALRLPASAFALKTVRWDDGAAQRAALLDFVSAPPQRDAVRRLVADYTWHSVARQIAASYREVAGARDRAV